METSSLSQCNVNTQARQLKESSSVTLSHRHFLVVLGISSPMGRWVSPLYIYIYIHILFLGCSSWYQEPYLHVAVLSVLRGTLCALEGSQIWEGTWTKKIAWIQGHAEGKPDWDVHLPPFSCPFEAHLVSITDPMSLTVSWFPFTSL